MKTFKKLKKGFTLVELVVVIAVIAILAAVSVGAYFGVTESANNSKLEQEAKQVYTAIQTVALAPNDHSSLDKTGLSVSNPGKFELALEESLGREVALTDVQDTKDDTDSTICFFTATQVSGAFGDTKYNSFEYHVPGINGKKAVANVVTGEVNVIGSEAENGEIAPTPLEISLEKANEIGEALEHNVYTTPQEYILSGTITDISNTQFGNMIITSGEDSFSIYGLYQGENRYDAIADRPTMGDTVKVQGAIGNFNGTAQIKSAQLLSFEKGEYIAPDPEPISIEDAIALGLEQYNNSYTSVDYIVTGTIHSVKNTEYGNIYVTDGTNLLYVYGIVGFADLENKPDEGDTITLQGKIGKYSDAAQMKDATLISFIPGEVVPEEPKENTATITFDNLDKATFSTEEQIWTENDIKVTNNKGTGSAIDVSKKYHNPARFYKDSIVTIEYTKNIVSMEITADSSDYATVLVNSIGVEATSTLDKVNVVLGTAAKTYTFTMSAQARVVSIDVTYDPTDVPTEPEHTHTFVNNGPTCDDPTCNEVNPDYVEPEIPTIETFTISFQNNWLWSDVRVHYWGSEQTEDTNWPGTPMTYKDNDGSYDFYTAVIPTDAEGYLFTGIKNDGSGTLDQSPNIESSNENFNNENGYWSMNWADGNVVSFTSNKSEEPEQPKTPVTVTKTIEELNTSYDWLSGSAGYYSYEFSLDENIKILVTKGRLWDNGKDLRLYASQSSTFVISCLGDYTINSIELLFSGTCSNITNDTETNVNSSSFSLSINAGQTIKMTSVSVTYTLK